MSDSRQIKVDSGQIKVGKNNTIVRRIEVGDVDIVVPIVMEQVPLLPHYKGIKVDRSRLDFHVRNAATAKDESAFMIRLLVTNKGLIIGGVAAYCVTQILSWDKHCSDIFLYVVPEWRTMPNVMKLIDAYKTWAHERNASIIDATHTGGYRTEAMDKLLSIAGFESIGTIYRLQK